MHDSSKKDKTRTAIPHVIGCIYLFITVIELWKILGPNPCGGASIGLSRHHNGPLQWCSACIRSRRFSSSVTSRPL